MSLAECYDVEVYIVYYIVVREMLRHRSVCTTTSYVHIVYNIGVKYDIVYLYRSTISCRISYTTSGTIWGSLHEYYLHIQSSVPAAAMAMRSTSRRYAALRARLPPSRQSERGKPKPWAIPGCSRGLFPGPWIVTWPVTCGLFPGGRVSDDLV